MERFTIKRCETFPETYNIFVTISNFALIFYTSVLKTSSVEKTQRNRSFSDCSLSQRPTTPLDERRRRSERQTRTARRRFSHNLPKERHDWQEFNNTGANATPLLVFKTASQGVRPAVSTIGNACTTSARERKNRTDRWLPVP